MKRDRGTGRIFQATYRDKHGDTQTCETWTIRYYAGGKPRKEGGYKSKGDAQKALTARLAQVHTGIVPTIGKATYEDLIELVTNDYAANERRSYRRVKVSLAHLGKTFRGMPARAITEIMLDKYIAARREEGASNASVNRELQVLRRGFRLARKKKLVQIIPEFSLLAEHNARKGFFEPEELAAVIQYLPAYVVPVVKAAYITGWRTRSELLPLTWTQVDFREGCIRLEPNTSKTDEGRTFYFTPELKEILEARRAETDRLQKAQGRVIQHVFTIDGKPFAKFERSWNTACRKAGLQGKIPHDFRRTAVRNLERAGVSRSVAKKISGHKTDTVYSRYAVASSADLKQASAQLAALGTSTGPVEPSSATITSIHAGQKVVKRGS